MNRGAQRGVRRVPPSLTRRTLSKISPYRFPNVNQRNSANHRARGKHLPDVTAPQLRVTFALNPSHIDMSIRRFVRRGASQSLALGKRESSRAHPRDCLYTGARSPTAWREERRGRRPRALPLLSATCPVPKRAKQSAVWKQFRRSDTYLGAA